jgi:hypothetical protein
VPEPDRPARWSDTVAPEWLDDLEYVWSRRMEARAQLLDARVRRYTRKLRDWCPDSTPRLRVVLARACEWAQHRAQAIRMRRRDVVEACGQRWRSIECGCGPFDARVECDQPTLCPECRKKHAMKWRKRITAGMERALRSERATWYRTPSFRRRGYLPGVYLITLTGPHSGDLATDRTRLGAAVRKLLKHATWRRWWKHYALTWEVAMSPDGDGLGHVHCHLAVVSSWVPYSSEEEECAQMSAMGDDVGDDVRAPSGRRKVKARWGLHEMWRHAMPGALVLDVRAPKRGQTDSDAAFNAAGYLAKYVTKGVEPSEFTGTKAGELLVAFAGRRKVSTSENFWHEPITVCECCKQEYRSLGAPVSLREHNPGAFIRTFLPYSSSQPSQMNLSSARRT